MRIFFFLFLILALAVVLIFGFRGPEWRRFSSPPIEVFPDMDHQPKYKSQAASSFFADGRADRLPVEGTVPFGVPLKSTYFASGQMNGRWGNGMPDEVKTKGYMPVSDHAPIVIENIDQAFLERGRQRYMINCAVCHGLTGEGDGVTSKYGLVGIANLQQENFVNMEDGQIFHTISHGKGQMGAYPHIKIEDRWAIVAYIRALQRTQHGKPEELSPEELQQLESQK